MPSDGKQLFAAYLKTDKALVRAGFHATSDAWMTALEDFWLSGATRMVVRKGRQSGWSKFLERVMFVTGLYGKHRVSRGTRLAFPFISIALKEVRERMYGLGQIAAAMNVQTRTTADAIEVIDPAHPPIVWPILACNHRTAVGLTAGAAAEDEMSRWMNEDQSANPAREVDAAITPMLATQPNGRIYSGSSPLATEDYHHELFERGNTKAQRVYFGPSWHWNPTITEATTRRLQPDEKIWSREFAAVPSAARNAAFDTDRVAFAFERAIPMGRQCRPRLILDPSSGKADPFVAMVIAWVVPRDKSAAFRPYLRVLHVETIAESYSERDGEVVADKIAALAKEWGCEFIDGDQREEFMLGAAIRKRGYVYTARTWTAQNKPQAVERVRRWLADGTLALPAHDRLRRELLGFEERINANGMFTFGARGKAHDDHVALLLTAAMAELDGALVPDRSDGPSCKIITPVSRWSEPNDDHARHDRDDILPGTSITIHDADGTRTIVSGDGNGGGFGSLF